MVPADCVSVLLMALGNTTITKAQFDMMSALDGKRTASSFEHQFRPITAKAKDLKARVDAGEAFVPVQPTKKRSGYCRSPGRLMMLTKCTTQASRAVHLQLRSARVRRSTREAQQQGSEELQPRLVASKP